MSRKNCGFKQGRGFKMLEQLDKENRSQVPILATPKSVDFEETPSTQTESSLITYGDKSNSSTEFIEGTPSPVTYTVTYTGNKRLRTNSYTAKSYTQRTLVSPDHDNRPEHYVNVQSNTELSDISAFQNISPLPTPLIIDAATAADVPVIRLSLASLKPLNDAATEADVQVIIPSLASLQPLNDAAIEANVQVNNPSLTSLQPLNGAAIAASEQVICPSLTSLEPLSDAATPANEQVISSFPPLELINETDSFMTLDIIDETTYEKNHSSSPIHLDELSPTLIPQEVLNDTLKTASEKSNSTLQIPRHSFNDMATTASEDRSSSIIPFKVLNVPGKSGSGQSGVVRPLVIPQQQQNKTDSDDSDADPKWQNHVYRPAANMVIDSDDSDADPNWQSHVYGPAANMVIDSSSDSDTQVVDNTIPKKIKTSRWHKKNKETYDRNLQKANRSMCLPYKNYKKIIQPPKAPKSDCKCKLRCSQNISEEDRAALCKYYWGLDYNRQKDFILNNIKTKAPERVLARPNKRIRSVTRTYSFKINSEIPIKVCQSFFTKTLCISNGPVNKAFSKAGTSGSFDGEDARGKHEPHNKTKVDDVFFVKEHIESFPTMESHYCRKTSSKKYLDSTLSISKLYELYTEKCDAESRTKVSEKVYRNIFCTQYNLDFHKPKKDQCLLCHKYKSAQEQKSTDLATWQKKYEEHISLHKESQEAKEQDKVRANQDRHFMSITLDLQKVLNLPTSRVSLLYYLRKLKMYNATIYEARSPNDGFCYLWSEVDGKKGSDEVGTAMYLWIMNLPSTVTEISIFSDTCGGQNRNQYVLCLLLYLVQTTHLEVIEHKYLESGHSHMEVDSIHSAIEYQMNRMSIFSKIDLCNAILLARSQRKRKKGDIPKKPYQPIVLKHTDILDLKDLGNNMMQNRSNGTDGEKLQWLKVKCFRFEKNKPGIVKYRYDYHSDFKEINVLRKHETTATKPRTKNLRNRKQACDETTVQEFDFSAYSLKKAYNKPLTITKAKKKDLMKMCSENIIPPELHAWYKSLPEKEGQDMLSDEDDGDGDDESGE